MNESPDLATVLTGEADEQFAARMVGGSLAFDGPWDELTDEQRMTCVLLLEIAEGTEHGNAASFDGVSPVDA